MIRLVWRQRRRILFSAFFTTVGLMMFVADMSDGFSTFGATQPILGLTILITSLVVMICAAAVSALFVVILPKWRQLLELMSFNIFVGSTVSLFFPSAFDLPYIGGFIPFIIYLILFSLIYGEALDRFRIGLDHKSCRHFTSPLDAQTLWRKLVPGAAPVAEHWDPLLHDLTEVADDPDSLEASYTHGASLYQLQSMTYLERNAPSQAKYYYAGQVDPKNRSLVEGTYEITITPREDKPGCRVSLCQHTSESLPRVALLQWFDDELGDRTDYLRAQQSGKRDWSMTGLYRRKVLQFA